MEKEYAVFNERVRLALRMAFPGRPVSAADELADSLASGTTIARVSLGAARDAVLMAALAHWLTAEAGRTALVVAPEDRDVAGLKKAFDQTGLAAGLGCTILGRDGVVESADVTIGSLDAIATRTAAGVVDARGFDVVALSGLDSLSDVASAAMLRRAIGPANESRRLVALSSILGPAHRNLVRDLGGAYVELELEAEEERVKMAPCVTYDVPSDKKMALFRSVLETYRARPVAVFCDVRGTAEETAKALRASGMRVEYILGALPRKKAIFDSVRSGAYEVLVLTDEGADGLPAAWAPLLVNWDLPLEGEPYLQRLSHLATTSPDAHVFNFACERYSYGIPAIERVLGASLAVVQPDSSVQASVPSPRPAPPAGQKGAGDDRSGGDRRDRGGQYDGRNARSIQANIAAITGGAVFREPEKKDKPEAVAREKRGRTGSSAKKKKNARQAAESPRAATNGTARGEARKPPAGTEAHSAPRKGSARPRRGSGGRSGAGKLADPYSVSMEERLRLYRERYGSRVDGSQERPPKGAPKGSPKGARRGDRNDAAAKPSAPESKDDSSPRSGGLAGAIRSLFGKKDD